MRQTSQISTCFFGEGALGQGLLYESSGAELFDTDLKCTYQRARYRGVVVKT